MKKPLIQICLLFICLLFACGPSSERKELEAKNMAQLDSIAVSAGLPNLATNRQFMRSAELNIKVNNVRTTTFKIEQTVASFGGFVLLSEQHCNTEFVSTTTISADSSEKLSSCQHIAEIKLRVPESELDSVLHEIEKQGVFIDQRVVKAEEANAQLAYESLKQKRSNNSTKRLKTLEAREDAKLKDVLSTEDKLIVMEENADQALLNQMVTRDKIAFSTVEIHLYQNPIFRKEILLNYKPSPAYDSPLSTKIMASLQWGLHVLEVLFLAIIRLWPFILLSVLGFYFAKKVKLKIP